MTVTPEIQAARHLGLPRNGAGAGRTETEPVNGKFPGSIPQPLPDLASIGTAAAIERAGT